MLLYGESSKHGIRNSGMAPSVQMKQRKMCSLTNTMRHFVQKYFDSFKRKESKYFWTKCLVAVVYERNFFVLFERWEPFLAFHSLSPKSKDGAVVSHFICVGLFRYSVPLFRIPLFCIPCFEDSLLYVYS